MPEPRGTLRAVDTSPAAGLIAQVVLLTALAATVGLGASGWIVGAACGVVVDALLARGLLRDRTARLGPAGWVTLARATLAVGVAALTADSFFRDAAVGTLVALAAVALVLDLVDGQVARRTGTTSRLGGRMDGEVDAFLIAALSVYVAPELGAWVLAIGAARYAFLLGEWRLEWMRAGLPPRYWRKVVAATQGVTLTVAAADVLPLWLSRATVAVALALLLESFGRDAWWLWRHRHEPGHRSVAKAAETPPAAAAAPARPRTPLRAGLAIAVTAVALGLVWGALVAPNEPRLLTPGAFLRVPLEGVLVVVLALLLPVTARRALAWVVGPLLGVLLLVKVLDIGFFTAFDRPFNPVDDLGYADIGIETLRASIGRTAADVAVVGLVVLGVAVLALPALAVLRVTRVAAGRRRLSLGIAGALLLVWLSTWALGAQLVSDAPIASTSAADVAVREVEAVQDGLADGSVFAREIRLDPFKTTPGDRLLTDLRGKDVLLVFVESYGKVAVESSSFSPRVDALLDDGTRRLQAAGFGAQSGWLTSPTFGGISWLAHSTMQSGVWVDTQGRYDQLVGSDRFTLSQAFKRAGWRTVGQVPANDRTWPEGSSYYHYDRVYDRRHVGYRGPTFSYAPMPDQYVLEALQRLELGRTDRPPLFAEVDLVSSHTPWTRIPPLVDWDDLGDGSIFNELPVDETALNADRKAAYGRSIEYSLSALISFVERYGSDDLVMIVLGDHQPSTVVTGHEASHDVPVSVIAHDPAVLRDIAGWRWVDGLRPGPAAPVWRMSDFRDRFLGAFGP
jgi:phosphatidylglycerophosphate synthase